MATDPSEDEALSGRARGGDRAALAGQVPGLGDGASGP
jgi:hypothetical protein